DVEEAAVTAVCEDGLAAGYPCHNVDLVGHMSLAALGATGDVEGNDHWGWTDPESGRQFVLFGLTTGTAFVEISDPTAPRLLGYLPGKMGESSRWWDQKVYQNYAFIVGDAPTTGGMQIFDLTQLLSVPLTQTLTFTPTAVYTAFASSHNLWINEASATLYAFRNTGDTCNAAIHMVDISQPLAPEFVGCLDDGQAPLSDAECMLYDGPDSDYTGREICFIGSDDNVAIADVTDKSNPVILSDFVYPGIVRAHQGSLTADKRVWLLSDTMDEMMNGHRTRTHLIDVQDLDNPVYLGYHEHETNARDHNVYVNGQFAYQTNWQAGLRVLHAGRAGAGQLTEMAYFDTMPDSDSVVNVGAWSNYPWWGDGLVTVSDIQGGLFILRVDVPQVFVPLLARGE
ncbi:MAG: choice-of-anchor B family protein, partial [Anaerolineales bacterium]|nr:choice-of-anchor B family protein [Anaerolineales bacterium]